MLYVDISVSHLTLQSSMHFVTIQGRHTRKCEHRSLTQNS